MSSDKVRKNKGLKGLAIGGTLTLGSGALMSYDQLPVEFNKRGRILGVQRDALMLIGDATSPGRAIEEALENAPNEDGTPPKNTIATSQSTAKNGDILGASSREYKVCKMITERLIDVYNKKMADSMKLPRFSPGRLYVTKSDDINAYTLSNGDIYVTTGLINFSHHLAKDPMGSHDLLAFVLGHEISHNVLQHLNERLSATASVGVAKIIFVALAMVFLPPGTEWVADALLVSGADTWVDEHLLLLPYSRLHEFEADRLGIQIASAACFDAMAGSELFFNGMRAYKAEMIRKMAKNTDGSVGVADVDEKSDYYSTHPGDKKRCQRLAALESRVKRLYSTQECADLRKDYIVAARALNRREWSSIFRW